MTIEEWIKDCREHTVADEWTTDFAAALNIIEHLMEACLNYVQQEERYERYIKSEMQNCKTASGLMILEQQIKRVARVAIFNAQKEIDI